MIIIIKKKRTTRTISYFKIYKISPEITTKHNHKAKWNQNKSDVGQEEFKGERKTKGKI